jgi:hypothetical protein
MRHLRNRDVVKCTRCTQSMSYIMVRLYVKVGEARRLLAHTGNVYGNASAQYVAP